MEGSTSVHSAPGGLTARVLPAVYLFSITTISGVIIGHAIVTAIYHPNALGWVDALAIPLVIFGIMAYKAHLRALEEHTAEEYLQSLRKGFSAFVIYFIAFASLISGLVTGGIFAVDNADQKRAEEEANETIATGKPIKKALPKNAVTKDRSIPDSSSKKADIPGTEPDTLVQSPKLQLRSIIGDSSRRTALINNAVLGEDQSSTIKVDGITYQVKCLKIEDNQVTLVIEGQTNHIVLRL